MTRKAFFKERDRIAFTIGLLVLGYADFSAKLESNGKKPSKKDHDDFQEKVNHEIGVYASLCKRKVGK